MIAGEAESSRHRHRTRGGCRAHGVGIAGRERRPQLAEMVATGLLDRPDDAALGLAKGE
jgi:hypothetical protein